MTQKTLFISYDGLLDPLGASQILPYVESIARHPRKVHVLSFEKPAKLANGEAALRRYLEAMDIGWTPLPFTRGGKLAKLWDLLRMYTYAIRLQRRHDFGIIHARSYQAAQVACLLRRLFAVKVLFDMRGLWVDERIDGGLWRLDRWTDRTAYHAYKRVERRLLYCADHVISLTRRVLPELAGMAPGMRAGVSVIPCCADFSHFRILPGDAKSAVRERMGIDPDAFVISYLGSLGTWYMLDEMFRFFIQAARTRTDIEFLLITRDWSACHEERMSKLGGGDLQWRLHVVSASRDEVPEYIGSSDVMLSFIKPAYSKLASSPTKLAEAYACGVPTICNKDVGDVDAQTVDLNAGAIVDLSDPNDVLDVIGRLNAIRDLGGQSLRARAEIVLDLAVAADTYRHVYQILEAV